VICERGMIYNFKVYMVDNIKLLFGNMLLYVHISIQMCLKTLTNLKEFKNIS
jgi:hypothetical protein